ncbi:MAG TPA: hypothetical protein VGQ90_05925 [Stellaceae bacterium]|nr:hypothetical protein [Stellaceae bacterium]
MSAAPRGAAAYTAAGDRVFAATGILPQIAPTDQIYLWSMTTPLAGGAFGAPTRATDLGAVYEKTITERLGLHLQGAWVRIDREDAGAAYGFENFSSELKYLAINDHGRELLLTLGLDREWGGTGARRIGEPDQGATEPRLYFGKGLGDLDIGYLRPFAVTGFVGYAISDGDPRPDLVKTGLAVQYSVPYLQSKVQSFDLPALIRGLTPMTEVRFTIPAGHSFGARTTALVAPGINFAGEGWEVVLEALVPATRATGDGVGVRAQVHVSLDFLFPETVGRPLFPVR